MNKIQKLERMSWLNLNLLKVTPWRGTDTTGTQVRQDEFNHTLQVINDKQSRVYRKLLSSFACSYKYILIRLFNSVYLKYGEVNTDLVRYNFWTK